MKTLGLLICLLGIATTALAEEHLWDNFDEAAVGSIADQTGWASASWLSTQTAQVSSAESFSPSNSLELAWHANGSSAGYTNFSSSYNPSNDHPVIRFSARLYIENTNVPFQIGICKSTGADFLSFQNKNGSGVFGFHPFNTAIPLVTGSFVDVIGYYNRSNNTYRLDYDNVTVVPWGPSDEMPMADFEQFLVTRLTNTASTTGGLFVDNVRVETFPDYVTAWWRCDDPEGTAHERLGCLLPARRNTFKSYEHTSSSDPVYDGQFDFHNPTAYSRFFTYPGTNALDTSRTTNWTAEAVFRTGTNANMALVGWGVGNGSFTTSSYISISYVDSSSSFYIYLRDEEQPNGQSTYTRLGSYTADNRWHHLAVVKSNTTLSLFFDYQFMAQTNILDLSGGTTGDGTYQFTTNCRATVGETLNGGNTAPINSRIDEARFSSQILELSEFLQPGQPLLVDLRNSALLNPWELTVKVILDRTYRVETSPALGAAADWQKEGLSFVGAYTFQFVDVSTVPKTNFVRVIREN
jgi:hypothetical protein